MRGRRTWRRADRAGARRHCRNPRFTASSGISLQQAAARPLPSSSSQIAPSGRSSIVADAVAESDARDLARLLAVDRDAHEHARASSPAISAWPAMPGNGLPRVEDEVARRDHRVPADRRARRNRAGWHGAGSACRRSGRRSRPPASHSSAPGLTRLSSSPPAGPCSRSHSRPCASNSRPEQVAVAERPDLRGDAAACRRTDCPAPACRRAAAAAPCRGWSPCPAPGVNFCRSPEATNRYWPSGEKAMRCE